MTKIARSPRSKRRELENWFIFRESCFPRAVWVWWVEKKRVAVSREKKSGCCFYAGWFGGGPVSDDSIDPRHTTVNSRRSFLLFAVCLRHSGLSGLIRYRITYVRCERRKSIEKDAKICRFIFIVLDARRDEVFIFFRFLRKISHAQVCSESLSGIVTDKRRERRDRKEKARGLPLCSVPLLTVNFFLLFFWVSRSIFWIDFFCWNLIKKIVVFFISLFLNVTRVIIVEKNPRQE